MNLQTKNLLKELEKTQKKYWNVSFITGQFLNLLIKDRKYKKILEIGTSNGYSGLWIAEALSFTKGHLYTIESHKKERFSLAEKNFKLSGLAKYITQIQGHAPEVIPSQPKFFDMAFLDATKYEYIDYFNAIKNRIKKGGVIIADNIISHKNALNKFIKTVKKDSSWSSVELNLKSGLLICIKV